MRDNRLDVIRGFAILLLTTTHISPGPELLERFGHYFIIFPAYFHGADVFVAFSGIVCGLVYRRTAERHGPGATIRKGLGRALQLFAYNTAAFVMVAVVVAGFAAFGITGPVHHLNGSPAEAAAGTILLYHPIQFFGILSFYILMLVLLPFFILAQMRWRGTILVSAALYIGYTAWHLAGGQSFAPQAFFVNPLTWQFLFFGGTAVGMNYAAVRAAMPPLSRSIGPIMLYMLVTHFMRDQQWITHNFSAKYDLGFLRIVDLVLFSYLVDQLVRPDVRVTAPVLQSISSLGSNSLFCFSLSLPMCYLTSLALVTLDGSRAAYLAAVVLSVLVMIGIGRLLLNRPGLRAATQIKFVSDLVERPAARPAAHPAAARHGSLAR